MTWTNGSWIFWQKRSRRTLNRYIVTSLHRSKPIQRCNKFNGVTMLLSRIREAAEAAKIKLSRKRKLKSRCRSHAGIFIQLQTHARELENLTRDIITRTRQHCLRALSDAKLEAKDLDQVILVGDRRGCARPKICRRTVRLCGI